MRRPRMTAGVLVETSDAWDDELTHSNVDSTGHQSSPDDTPDASKSDSSTTPKPIARDTDRSAAEPCCKTSV